MASIAATGRRLESEDWVLQATFRASWIATWCGGRFFLPPRRDFWITAWLGQDPDWNQTLRYPIVGISSPSFLSPTIRHGWLGNHCFVLTHAQSELCLLLWTEIGVLWKETTVREPCAQEPLIQLYTPTNAADGNRAAWLWKFRRKPRFPSSTASSVSAQRRFQKSSKNLKRSAVVQYLAICCQITSANSAAFGRACQHQKKKYFTSCDPHHDMTGHVRTYIWTNLEYILTF